MAAKNRRMLTFDALVAEFAAVRAEGGGEMSKTETCADSTPTPEEKRRGEDAVLLEPLKKALRHISHFADTLSPQEVINVCADALGVDRHEYAGECHPDRSLVEMRGLLARLAKSMDAWASQEDGILDWPTDPNNPWCAITQARAVLAATKEEEKS